MRKKLIILIAVITIASIFVILKPKQSVGETVIVSRQTITDTIVQSGNITAVQESMVFATSTGLVDKIMVTNGELVVAGQEIARIKSTSTDKDRSAAYAAYLAAITGQKSIELSKTTNQALLESARKNVLDTVSLEKNLNDNLGASKSNPTTGKSYTQEEIDSIRSSVASARQNFSATERKYLDSDTGIQSAKASVISAFTAYNATKDTVVKAPIDGTIANLNVSIGDNTTASSVQSTGSRIVHIINMDAYRLGIKVTELQIAKIQLGLPVTIVFDAFPEQAFNGTIVKSDTIGTVEQGLITYNIEISLESPNSAIKPGMSATVEIDVAQKQDTLAIPVSALKTDGEKKFVKVLENNKVVDTAVKIGMRGSKYIEVLEGVSEGTRIVIDTKK